MCELLRGYVNKIIVSFLDDYKNVRANYKYLKYLELNEEDYQLIGESFSRIAKDNNITVQTCFEENDLTQYGFIKGECLSHELAYMLTGKKYKNWKARGGGSCGCVEMVDIGDYNSCKHLCKYCYANYDEKKVNHNMLLHDPNSSLLIGTIKDDDEVKIRKK